jgi:hypothetical protein
MEPRYRLVLENIYQITVGSDPLKGMSWKIGQTVHNHKYKITRIIRHEDSYELHGEVMYIVYVEKISDPGFDFEFRSYSNVPISVTCDLEKQYEDVRDLGAEAQNDT